jgi:predicted nucleic acid-binding protein
MKTKTFVLDTSFLLALLNTSDLLHNQVTTEIFSIDSDIIRFEVPLVCVTETLIKGVDPNGMIDLLTELINQKDFEINIKDDLEFIGNLPLKTRSSLKANDCCVLAISKRLNAQLLTLDKKLLKAYLSI